MQCIHVHSCKYNKINTLVMFPLCTLYNLVYWRPVGAYCRMAALWTVCGSGGGTLTSASRAWMTVWSVSPSFTEPTSSCPDSPVGPARRSSTPPVWSVTRHLPWLIDLSLILAHDRKLRKYLSLSLYSEYFKFYLKHCFNNLQIGAICTFKHNIKIWVDYHNYCKSYTSVKFWHKSNLSLWSWTWVSRSLIKTHTWVKNWKQSNWHCW